MAATIALLGHNLDLKWVSLLTLALQNALLSVLMHYSRIASSPAKTYSASSAVLMNGLLKGTISLVVALRQVDAEMNADESHARSPTSSRVLTKPDSRFPPTNDLAKQHVFSSPTPPSHALAPYLKRTRWRRLAREIFSPDCWKLSIPAILYVIQNNLQYVAASNLDVATFQVTYQMKILTTAFFSVLLLGKRLSSTKWFSLLLLAVGVGIVQIQSTGQASTGHAAAPSVTHAIKDYVEHAEHKALRSEIPSIPSVPAAHEMNPFKGFMAVTAACMTSGLAGVYFEMVLKGTKADLWTRNIQLSFFSLIPALLPVLFNSATTSHGILGALVEPFANFSIWAWATVLTQVFGGLVTAIVIKYSDNILKGFATSLSIILSFLASVLLFAYPITPAFIIGSIVVLSATWMYNQPEPRNKAPPGAPTSRTDVAVRPGSPIRPDAPIIGETPKPSRTPSVASLINLAGSITRSSTPTATHGDHLQPSHMPYGTTHHPTTPSGYFTPSNMSPFPSSQSLTPSATPPSLSPSTSSYGFTHAPRYVHGSTTPTTTVTSSGPSYRPPIHVNTHVPSHAMTGGLHIHLADPTTAEEAAIPSSPFTATTSYSSGPGGVLRDSPVRERKGSLAAARTQRPVVVDMHSSYDKMR